jgi:hypothetical protein
MLPMDGQARASYVCAAHVPGILDNLTIPCISLSPQSTWPRCRHPTNDVFVMPREVSAAVSTQMVSRGDRRSDWPTVSATGTAATKPFTARRSFVSHFHERRNFPLHIPMAEHWINTRALCNHNFPRNLSGRGGMCRYDTILNMDVGHRHSNLIERKASSVGDRVNDLAWDTELSETDIVHFPKLTKSRFMVNRGSKFSTKRE